MNNKIIKLNWENKISVDDALSDVNKKAFFWIHYNDNRKCSGKN